jgi:hypothetical protein
LLENNEGQNPSGWIGERK